MWDSARVDRSPGPEKTAMAWSSLCCWLKAMPRLIWASKYSDGAPGPAGIGRLPTQNLLADQGHAKAIVRLRVARVPLQGGAILRGRFVEFSWLSRAAPRCARLSLSRGILAGRFANGRQLHRVCHTGWQMRHAVVQVPVVRPAGEGDLVDFRGFARAAGVNARRPRFSTRCVAAACGCRDRAGP